MLNILMAQASHIIESILRPEHIITEQKEDMLTWILQYILDSPAAHRMTQKINSATICMKIQNMKK